MVLFNRRKYMRTRRSPQGAPIDIADATITVADSVQYTGTPRTPSVTVVYDGVTLVVNQDYYVSYNDNTNLGAATAVITGTGEFTGQVVKTFQIVSASGGGDWQFDLDDFPDTVTFSQFGNLSLTYQICPSQDESKLLVGGVADYYLFGGDMSNFNPTSLSNWVNSGHNVNAGTMMFTPDGIHFLCAKNGGSYMYMYILPENSDPYDVSAMPQDASSRNSSLIQYLYGGSISSDGTKILYIKQYSEVVRIYSADLSTPWDLSTISNVKESSITLSVDSDLGYGPLFVNPHNGTQIIVGSKSRIAVYTLRQAWDASSLDSASQVQSKTIQMKRIVNGESVDFGTDYRRIYGIAVNNAGNKIILTAFQPLYPGYQGYVALVDLS